MKYAAEMGSGAIIYIPNFNHSKVVAADAQTQTACRSYKPTFIFSK
jgi:hypothetical protein